MCYQMSLVHKRASQLGLGLRKSSVAALPSHVREKLTSFECMYVHWVDVCMYVYVHWVDVCIYNVCMYVYVHWVDKPQLLLSQHIS